MPLRPTGPGWNLEPDQLLRQFDISPAPPNKTCRRVRCIHCLHSFAENTTRMRGHLSACRAYKRRLPDSPASRLTVREMMQANPQPTTELRDEAAAAALLIGGCSLNLWQPREMKHFIRLVSPNGSNYVPPSRNTIINTWLPVIYSRIQQEVLDEVINASDCLNIIFDASDDTGNLRQLNISVATPDKPAVFWRMIDTGSIRHTARETANFVKEAIADLVAGPSGPEWGRINAFVSDTCNPAVAACRVLIQDPGLQHTFAVYCDSHGL